MKTLSLAPPITCPRCSKHVFPYIKAGMYFAKCVECDWGYYDKLIDMNVIMSASTRFNELCDAIEKQGKSGQLLEVLRQNFSDFLAYVESEEMKRCDALAIGVNTLATLAVLKHI